MRYAIPLVAAALVASSSALFADPEASLEALATPPAPPAMPSQTDRVLCLVDTNFDNQSSNIGTWNLQVGGGVISGTATYDGCPPYNVSGTYAGPSFTVDMTPSAPSSCCESGLATGTVSRAARNAEGTITWMCNGVPLPGATTRTLCP